MNHEKILVRAEGNKVKIRVNFWMRYDKPVYDIAIYTCEKGKRTWRTVDFETYDYKRLSMEEREDFRMSKLLELVTPDEILYAKAELWNNLNPAKF